MSSAIVDGNFGMTNEETSDLLNKLDFAQNGRINYTEFLAATINVQSYLTDEKLDALFNSFDVEGKGKITKENIMFVFEKFGK